MPCRRSRSGSVSSSARVDHDARRPVERADEVLALGEVDRRLAADRRVDLADERRRHGDPRHAAQVRRGGEAGDVGRAAAAERDERAVAVEPQLAPEPLERRRAPSPPRPAGSSCVGGEPVAERELRARRRGCPSRARRRRARPGPSPGTSSPSRSSAPSPYVDAAGGEHGARRRRATTRVGDLARRAAARSSYSARNRASSCASGRSVPRTRSQAVSHGRRRAGRVNAAAQRLAVLGRRDGAAAERDHAGLGRGERDAHRVRLDLAERLLPALVEELAGSSCRLAPRSRASRSTNGRPSRAASSRAERRLARAHEADRARACRSSAFSGHGMRSRYARRAATKSPIASPPNFSRAARASSHATAASATTASASTAATSLRSTSASAGSPVARSTEPQRLHQRRQRLHRRADDDLLAVRDAGLEPAGVVRLAPAVRSRSRRAPPSRACRRARSRRRSRRPSPPGCPSPRRRAARRGGPPSSRTSRARAGRRARAPRRRRRACRGRRAPRRSRLAQRPRSSTVEHCRRPRRRSSREQRLRDAPAATCTAVCRAAARSSALRTSSWPYLSTPARSAWPGRGSVTVFVPLPVRLALGRPRAHPPRPVLVVAVADDERERRAERPAVAQAGEHLDVVLLDLLARAAAVALLAAAEVGVDRGAVERRARRAAR